MAKAEDKTKKKKCARCHGSGRVKNWSMPGSYPCPRCTNKAR